MSDTLRVSDAAAARVAPSVRVRRRQRRWLRPLALMIGPALLLLVAAYFYLSGGRYVSTDDAYVRAGITQVSTDIPGRVAEIDVHENETVKAGDVLLRLDDKPFRFALERAQAQLQQSRLNIEALRATYAQKQVEIKLAQENIDYLSREFDRQKQLLASHVASQAQYDQA
ncbi:MAG: biotin/lipoyl-binding protein, partial [Alphaproteobacteria bacterium]|nr:biotin/lipoyl-binding protein [Alphaproteobacteria bacterium]